MIENNAFRLNIPLTLDKAGDTENGWMIRGLASTEDIDLQGEIVKQKGLDISPIKDGRGWINYNHSNDPEDMVGKLNDADVSGKGLFVEGYLFKKHKKAQSIYSILKSLNDEDRHALKLSIEGQIEKRVGKDNKTIASAKVDKVAITFDPINTNTYVELVKSITDKTKEWNMDGTAQEKDLTKENIKSEGDSKVENDPANAADSATTETMNNGIDKVDGNYSGQIKQDPDVHELLTQIHSMLSFLFEERTAAKKAKDMSDLKDSLIKSIKEKVGKAVL